MKCPRTALLLETNEKNQELLSAFLRNHGISARGLTGMDEALAVDVTDFDIAIIDLAGLDPRVWDLCMCLHERGTPFLVIYPPHAREPACTAPVGTGGVLKKPLDPITLLSMVKAILGEDVP